MSKFSNDIPGFLGDKLSEATSPVDPSLWQNIADKLPTQAPVSGGESVAGSSTSGMSVAAKVAVWSGAAVMTGAAGYGVYMLTSSDDAPEILEITAPEPIVAPAPEINYEDVVLDEPEHPAGEAEEAPMSEVEQTQPSSDTGATASQTSAQPEEGTNTTAPTAAAPTPVAAESSSTPAAAASPAQQSSQAPTPAPAPAHAETPLSPDASADFNVAFDAHDELLATFTAEWQDGNNYTWDFGDGNLSGEVNPMHKYDEEGVYEVSLYVTDEHGNEVEMVASVDVRKTPILVLPNIFTPNNDGRNDILNISDESQNVTVLRIIVFDQQGKTVYEQFGPGIGWDGNLLDGSPAPEATYRMVVTAEGNDGKHYNESSFVRLQR